MEGTRRAATTANSLKTQLSEGTEAPGGALGHQNWRQNVYLFGVFFAKNPHYMAHVGAKKGDPRKIGDSIFHGSTVSRPEPESLT